MGPEEEQEAANKAESSNQIEIYESRVEEAITAVTETADEEEGS